MSILKVARLGHPIVRRVADPIVDEVFGSLEIRRLINDMIETMREYEGVGLAGPQVHEPKQLAVIEVKRNSRYPSAPEIPLMVLMNPVIMPLSEEMVEDWEGCLSVPDFRGRVPRYRQIEVHAHDTLGEKVEFVAHDFFARVIQHECDHLNGTVFLDRMPSLETLSYLSEYSRHWEDT